MNLNKEVKRNEETLKKVRLGASLFQILREDEEKKVIPSDYVKTQT
jgi:hypothetical protein